MKFVEKLLKISSKNNSLLCVGLDTDLNKIPKFLLKKKDPMFEFNKRIVNATSDLVCAYKPNMAFYETQGARGWKSLKETCQYIPRDIPIIIDAKRGDIGNTAKMYAKAFFEELKADAITLSPYMGEDAILPFAEYEEKCAFVLCLTSNAGAEDFQFLESQGEPLYVKVARKVVMWNKDKNLGLVLGATQAEQLSKIREIAADLPILIPGIGAQGGNLKMAVELGTDKNGNLAVINSSRSILYASDQKDFALKAGEEAEKLKEEINLYRKQ